MKSALFILLSFCFCQFSFGQVTQPTYRTHNGIPDVAGFNVVNPSPRGGLIIYTDKDGTPTFSPLKIRRYQPESGQSLMRTASSNFPNEQYFSGKILPPSRTTSEFIAPIPLRDRRLELEVPFNPQLHLMPFHLTPALNDRDLFRDYKLRDFNPRRDF